MQEILIDRVIIKTDFNYCQLVVPTKKDFAARFFSGLASTFFLAGIIGISISSFSQSSKINLDSFEIILLTGSIIAWLLIVRVFLWNIIGKETITIDDGLMTIDGSWMLFFKPKTYELKSVKNLRTDFDDDSYEVNKWNNSLFYNTGKLSISIKLGGTFLFDYNGETIKFGDSVDKDDADLILQTLIEMKVFSSTNIQPL